MRYNYQTANIYNGDLKLNDLKFFKEDELFKTITLPANKPNIKQLYDIIVLPEIANYSIVDTNVEVSNEGNKLLGYKIIAQVVLNLKLSYIVDSAKENICTTNFKILKNMTIVVPQNINSRKVTDIFKVKGVNLLPYVEHYHIKMIDSRSFNLSVLLILDAKFFK